MRAARRARIVRLMIVRPLEPEDVLVTARLLAGAMHDDPAYAFLFPRLRERRAGLEHFFSGNLRTHLRCAYVGVVDSSVVATVTMRPPEGISLSALTMMRRGLLPFAFAHGLGTVRRLLLLKSSYDAIEARLARGERHWLVHMMAVDRARQGSGLGRTLLRAVLDVTVDARTAPALLTTHDERNVHFYRRAGFEVDDVRDVSLHGNAPYRVFCMRRGAPR
jgi:GNAT superfamily N-acetyltransferase